MEKLIYEIEMSPEQFEKHLDYRHILTFQQIIDGERKGVVAIIIKDEKKKEEFLPFDYEKYDRIILYTVMNLDEFFKFIVYRLAGIQENDFVELVGY